MQHTLFWQTSWAFDSVVIEGVVGLRCRMGGGSLVQSIFKVGLEFAGAGWLGLSVVNKILALTDSKVLGRF